MFLETLCTPYTVDGRSVLFVPVVTAPMGDEPIGSLSAALGLRSHEGKRWSVNAQVRRNADNTMTIVWPFAIDHDDYLDYVRSHGWRG